MAHQNQPEPPRVPHVFSNEPGHYAATTAVNSVFLVEAVIRHLTEIGDDEESPASYYNRSRAVYRNLAQRGTSDKTPSGPSEPKGVTMGITEGTKYRYSTGFAIAERGEILRILTCAHIFEDIFTKNVHELTVENLNIMFRFCVICVHQEREVRQKPSVLPLHSG